ncbi:two-component system sensor histidine kinase ResE [Cytobacillus eiseniae]|uniref:histidine kinase n=1 Tax=Cytobacillus eiseniae TaxID=762947 RepID=A0ABS4RCV1_9BACI|nr:ATP-binding protein [Cytobacillus eiseniae]MBP2240721.1 two-component system sensor histidine kinase ResE [Cytobacillus eiseniae]
MMFLRSVVGKLWFTIILLVSFVLFILTIMLLEFFDNYYINQTEKGLTNTTQKIARILDEHEKDIGLEIAWELVDDVTKIVVIHNENEFSYSPNENQAFKLPLSYLRQDKDLQKVFTENKTVQKMSSISESGIDEDHNSKILIIGVPLKDTENMDDAVFIYQSLTVMQETTRTTTKFIFLAAGVAIILTTIFAFFLSTRITAPLRKMREAAFEVAKGKFDTKILLSSSDEIGELAIAFNQMGKQLKFNMNALSQEKEQLASILSGMADGVITFNKDGTILITNPPAERFLQNWHYEKVDGEIDAGAVPSKVMELYQQAVDTEKEQVGEISIQGRFWVMIVSPLYNNEYIRGAVAVIRDMTEERKLDKLRQDFIANVSHELRTPISMMQGYSEAIVDDIAGTDEEKKEMARVIYDESLRMGRLVNELLDLARMEAGHIQLTIEDVEINPYLEKITRKFLGLAKEKGIHLECKIDEAERYFRFDPDRMEQVLINLIDNALRHTPNAGNVTVIERCDTRGLFIEVTDTGTGIPEEDLPFVFERFYKADKARTRGRSGTGLGLAIVKHIVTAHKGQISVQSKLGQGTTFSIFIPRKFE